MLYLMFVLGLILLAVGGDVMVSSSVEVAKKLKVSTLLIGIVLIGFGTSTPELVARIIATSQEVPATGIAVGNIVGSNIANILLILGVTSLIYPIKIDKKSFLKRDMWFLIFATAMVLLMALLKKVGFVIGGVMILSLLFYVYYSYITEKKFKKETKEIANEIDVKHTKSLPVSLIMAVIGIAMTIYGANLLVNSAIVIAKNFGISESIIGLTIVAVGTSLPELASSITASLKKHNELAFGNIVGSNIYNVLFILGVVSLLQPIMFPVDMVKDVYILIATTTLLIANAFMGGISRKFGVIYLIAYAFYVAHLMG